MTSPAPLPAPRPDASARLVVQRPPVSVTELPGLAELGDPAAFLASHSRSFRFAATLLDKHERARIARVYAWCRYTDNLVDGDVPADLAERRLDCWLWCSREAYEGRDSGIELVNRVMGETAERAIPFDYAHDLVRAMYNDVRFARYADLDALAVYTYRAAGVVGRWLTELHGVRDSWMLGRATALGQAMQLTNILRDVGEDLQRGRMYLPLASLAARGLDPAHVEALSRGERDIDLAYAMVMEDLMAVADAQYQCADEAVPHLPPSFGRSAAVASAVYRGIHDAIRANGYDNIRRRAYTTGTRKVALAAGAMLTAFRTASNPPARSR